jgi:cystathionine beta-lyase
MERHNENALKIANELHDNYKDKIKKVMYPGLASHPQHELAKNKCVVLGE